MVTACLPELVAKLEPLSLMAQLGCLAAQRGSFKSPTSDLLGQRERAAVDTSKEVRGKISLSLVCNNYIILLTFYFV